ncbi:MAG: preprotein translocase subunit YajC [Streptosporangiaceae bacterium]
MSNTLVQLLPIIAIVVLLYLVLIRPQQRRQRRMTDVRRRLQPGQRVMTNAGLFATVSVVDDEHVVLEVAPGVRCRFVKASVVQVIEDTETDPTETPAEATSDGEFGPTLDNDPSPDGAAESPDGVGRKKKKRKPPSSA